MHHRVDDFALDDLTSLPSRYRIIYNNPYKALGLDPDDCDTNKIRQAFRKASLGLCGQFWSLQKSNLSLEELVFAYHLLRRNIVGPCQKIKPMLDCRTQYLDYRCDDILPLLRPLKGNFEVDASYRGFRNLHIDYTGNMQVLFDRTRIITYRLEFVVNYCLRKHMITKTIEEFETIDKALRSELMIVPTLPTAPPILGWGYMTDMQLGDAYSDYMLRIHHGLAEGGHFSARLLEYLGINYTTVHSEEEGIIMSILDNPSPLPKSCWYIIDDNWLERWRKFALGRGPRRYLPPGRINNWGLLAELDKGSRDLMQGTNYRAVNWNVWHFLQMLYCGGPAIPRYSEDIYSRRSMSYMHGIIIVQSQIRIYLAKNRKNELYTIKFSESQVARYILRTITRLESDRQIREDMMRHMKVRLEKKVKEAITCTQKIWRQNHNLVPEENLERLRRDQDIFSKDTSDVSKESLIVQDTHPIIRIGSASVYDVKYEDQDDPFTLEKRPYSEYCTIVNSEKVDLFIDGSKILSINELPCRGMSIKEVSEQWRTAKTPLRIHLEKPPGSRSVGLRTFQRLCKLANADLKYSAFKLCMTSPTNLVRHTPRSVTSRFTNISTGGKRKYRTQLVLSDTKLFYREEFSVKKKESELWKSISLFSIKFIKTSDQIKKEANDYKFISDKDLTFSIVTEDEEFVLEYPSKERIEYYDKLETWKKKETEVIESTYSLSLALTLFRLRSNHNN